MMMAYQHIPTSHIPTKWEYVIMIKGGNITQSHSHHVQIHHQYQRITRSWSDYVSRERQPGDCISRVTQIRLTSPESSKPDNLFKNKITQPLTSPEFPESDHVPPELPKPDHLNIPRVNITRPSQHPPSKHNQTFCACPEYPNQTFSARPEYPNQTFSARPEYPNQTFCACPEYPKPDFLCTSRVSKTRLSFYVPIIRNQTFCACHEYTTNYRRNSGGTL